MRILLDACVPRGLRGSFSGHSVSTAHELDWGDLDNGDLLDAMGNKFDVLVTVDKGIPKQQHLADRPFGVLVLRARSNRLADLLSLAPEFEAALGRLHPGTVVEVSG
jgi:predicted nuclease of predicted toxin-antitoxin system